MTAFLILDDNPVFSDTLARSLSRRGFTVTVAHTGKQALEATQQTAFNLVTIDLQLEHDFGLHWIMPLRQALPQARLLILTAYASITTTVQAIKLGADNYLAKPANLDSILAALYHDSIEQPALIENTPAPLSVDRLQWEHIQYVLAQHQGNVSSTARALNMHRRTLQRRLAKKPVAK